MTTRREFLKIGGLSVALSGIAAEALGQAAAPPAKLENLTAGVKPLLPEDYEARRERARALMARENMDGLFLTGGVNLAYFTTVSWGTSERTFGALLPRKGGMAWVCPAFEQERAKELIPPGDDIRVWEEHESPYGLIAGILNDRGAASGRLGLAPNAAACFGRRPGSGSSTGPRSRRAAAAPRPSRRSPTSTWPTGSPSWPTSRGSSRSGPG